MKSQNSRTKLWRRGRILLAGAVVAWAFAGAASATPISGELFFTTFAGGTNVNKVSFSFDGAATFTLGAPVPIGTTFGADGIAQNPQNSDLLLVGGQGLRINTISKSTGTATSYPSPVNVFHLEVPDSTTVFGSGIPGAMARHTINPSGSLSPGTVITVSGSSTLITQLIDTPSNGFFYTNAVSSGFGQFGALTFGAGGYTTATTATTAFLASLPAAHGGVFDPFSGNIILFGDDHITQVDFTGAIISDINFAALGQGVLNFDQGTVDGLGHVYAASNSGHLVFIDYTATGFIGNASSFRSTQFLAANLDDIAPLVGSGGTPTVPEPETLALLALGLLSLGVARRRSAVDSSRARKQP